MRSERERKRGNFTEGKGGQKRKKTCEEERERRGEGKMEKVSLSIPFEICHSHIMNSNEKSEEKGVNIG